MAEKLLPMELQFSFNLKMEEYVQNLPQQDQSILREYFVVVGTTCGEIRKSRIGSVKSQEELLQEAVKQHCFHLPKKRYKKVFNVLNKAFKFSEPILYEMITSRKHVSHQNDIFVPGSNFHYKKEFLLKRISMKPDISVPDSYTKLSFKQTVQDTMSGSKVITSIDLSSLEPMKIIDLVPGKIHTNKTICATLLDDGFKMTAYHTIIEDKYGQCAKLCIYHISPVLHKSLKKGVEIAIANPLYKLGEKDGYYFIRTESPDEVVVLTDNQGINQQNFNSEDHKKEGNEFYKSGQYSEAITCYTRAVNSDSSNPVYVGNRAQSYLKLELCEEALLDSETAVKLDPTLHKNHYRLAMAWSGLGNHEKSLDILENINTENPDIRSAIVKQRRLLVNSKGKFDFDEMEMKLKQGEELEIGDYIGPITIGPSSIFGHGVFAIRDILKGEVIVVSKALAFAKESKNNISPLIEFDFVGKSSTANTRKLIDSVTAKVTKSKLAAFRVFNLYHKHRHQEHIPIELYTGKGYEFVRDKAKPPYQIEQIRTIVQNNECSYLPNKSILDESPSGFWPISSYFNHSCLSNTAPNFYRDVLVIRASIKILKGDEITSSFFSVFGKVTLEERKATLLEGWDFVCNCELCQFESDLKNKGLLDRGIRLLNRAKEISTPKIKLTNPMIQDSHFKLLNQAFSLAKEMNLGPTRFNASVWHAIHYLTNFVIDFKDHKKYYDVLMKAKAFICEYEIEHQRYYWIKCNGFVKIYGASVSEEFEKESEQNLNQIETLMKMIY